MHKLFQKCAGLLGLLMAIGAASSAHATVITLQFDNIGPIDSINPGSPEDLAGFSIGENLLLQVTFDDSLPDLEPIVGDGNFDDPSGKLKLIGVTSGATLEYFGGLEIEVDDAGELEFETLLEFPDPSNTPIVSGDIDFDTTSTFFTNPDSLSQIVADLLANPFPTDGEASASTTYWDGDSIEPGFWFDQSVDPVTVTLLETQIPEPSILGMLGFGLMGLAFGRWARGASAPCPGTTICH